MANKISDETMNMLVFLQSWNYPVRKKKMPKQIWKKC